jgi:hypothetical protein
MPIGWRRRHVEDALNQLSRRGSVSGFARAICYRPKRKAITDTTALGALLRGLANQRR